MPHSVHLRPALEQDFLVIAAWIHNAQECLRWAGPRVAFPFEPAQLAAQLALPGGGASYAVSDASGNCLGFGQYWQNTPDAVHLGRILVSPNHRGHGVGHMLCEQLLELGRQAYGVSKASLRVYRDNEAAIRLYRTLGFVPVPEQSSALVLWMAKHPA